MSRRSLILFLASGFGLGYAPVASGTFGTLAGVALYPLFDLLRTVSPILLVLATIALIGAAIWIAAEADRLLDDHDSGKIVIDEVAGYMVATLFVPLGLGTLAASFFLFRLFDVLKPWPAGWCDQKLPGGPGVVLDDVFSGIYANLSLRLIWWMIGVPL